MAAIPLCEAPLASLKRTLLDEFNEVKSSHITEALAFCMGFRTHAALQAAMKGPDSDRPFCVLDCERFIVRLAEFGYPFDPEDPEFQFDFCDLDKQVVVQTMPISAYGIHYRTMREWAWRNLMVCAVNAGLDAKLFTLRPGDDRFNDHLRSGHLFDFVLPNGLPARGSVATAGFDELAIHAAVNPKGDNVRYHSAGFTAGDVFATTWLERRDGVWLQSATTSFRCRRALAPLLASIDVEPQGYGDRGAVIM